MIKQDKSKLLTHIPEGKSVHQDHIYYNVDFRNNRGTKGPTKYSVQLSEPILDVAQNYHLAILRFSLPTSDIPFVYFRVQRGLTQTDPNLGVYKMTLRYDNTDFTSPVIYRSLQGDVFPVPPPPSQNGGEQIDSLYYNVYFVDNFLFMINQALAQCRDDLVAAYPALAPLEAAYYVYDPVTKFVNLIAPYDYFVNDVQLFYNGSLGVYLFGQPAEYILQPDKLYRVLITPGPNFDNAYFPPAVVPSLPPTFLTIKPNFSQIPYWGEMKGIVLRTNLIPVRSEFSASSNNGKIVSSPLLTDYLVENWDGTASNIVFNNIAPYRFIDLVSQAPLSQIEVEVFWKDVREFLRPMTLYTGDSTANLKLVFVKEGLTS